MRHTLLRDLSLLLCVALLCAACGAGEGPAAHGDAGPAAPPSGPAAAPSPDAQAPGPAPAPVPAPTPPAKTDLAPLLAKLGDQAWTTADEGVTGLIEAGPAAVPALEEKLGHEDPAVVEDALVCLEAIGRGGRNAVEGLLRRKPGFPVLVYCLRALGAVGDDGSKALLEPYLAWKDATRKEDDVYEEAKMADCREGKVRNQAAESLVRLGDTRHMAVLIEALRGNGWVRRDAIVSLRRLTDCSLDFGFALDAPDPDREKAVRSWQAWWKANQATWKPTYRVSRAVFDIYAQGRKKARAR